jgi:hypothetical protein
MATLKDIWTWPNNASTGYAKPAHWSGDASYGLDQRIQDLLSGGYLPWPGLNPVSGLGRTVADTSELFAKYSNYLDAITESDENLSFYKLHRKPIVEVTWNLFRAPVTAFTSTMKDTASPVPALQVTHGTNPGWVDGNQVRMGSITTAGFTGLNDSNQLYADVRDANTTWLFGGSGLNVAQPVISIQWHNSGSLNEVFIKNSTGCSEYIKGASYNGTDTLTYPAGSGSATNITDGDRVRFVNTTGGTTVFTEAHDTGTQNTLDSSRWVTTGNLVSHSDAIGSIQYYTNSGRTTGATLAETLYGTLTRTITNTTGAPATYVLNNVSIVGTTPWTYTPGSDSTLADMRDSIIDEKYWTSWGRLYYQNLTGGTITTGVGANNVRTFGGARDYDDLWFVYPVDSDNRIVVSEQAGDADVSHAQAFTLSAGASVTIVIEIINPARMRSFGSEGDVTWIVDSLTTNADGEINRWEWWNSTTASMQIMMPGVIQYTYLDTSGVSQPGATIDITKLWYPGATSVATTTPVVAPSAITVGLDSNKRLQTVSFASATLPGGVWNVTAGSTAATPVNSAANQYVAPVPYAEDVWDTDAEWDSTGFNVNKTWPTHRVPSGAKITVATPSSSVRSQNGTKYVRDAGFQKYQLELTYPPMTYDDFRIFQRTVEAAHGQSVPFLVQVRNIGPASNKTILFNRGVSGIAVEPRLKEPVQADDRVLLLEGFAADQADVFIPGEHIITSGANGGMHTVVNGVDSNVFGEARIRLTYAHNVTRGAGESVFRNPFHVIVTLAENELEYTVGTDMLYRFSVMFDFDEWK